MTVVQAACVARPGAVGREEMPLVEVRRFVEPDRVVERGRLNRGASRTHGMGQHGVAQEHHVGGVGEQSALQQRIGVRRIAQAHPHARFRFSRTRTEERARIERDDFDRSVLQTVDDRRTAGFAIMPAPAFQRVERCGYIHVGGGRGGMGEPLFGHMEGRDHRENQRVALRSFHAARCEAAAFR